MKARCEHCQRVMDGASCNKKHIRVNGRIYKAIPYGSEGGASDSLTSRKCHDCGTPVGGLHHLNCDMAECPACGHQQVACGCVQDEE